MAARSMLNHEVFSKDPLDPRYARLPNDGLTIVKEPSKPAEWDVLRYELRNFICDGQYQKGLLEIVRSFLDAQGAQNAGGVQSAVWISGFYGSGKSHLARVLKFLWANAPLPDGALPRDLANLPLDVADLLRELSTRGKAQGGLWSAVGTMSSGAHSPRLAFLGVILDAAGLPTAYPIARFRLWLRAENIEDAVRAHLQKDGTTLEAVETFFRMSKPLNEAIVAARPDLESVGQRGRAAAKAVWRRKRHLRRRLGGHHRDRAARRWQRRQIAPDSGDRGRVAAVFGRGLRPQSGGAAHHRGVFAALWRATDDRRDRPKRDGRERAVGQVAGPLRAARSTQRCRCAARGARGRFATSARRAGRFCKTSWTRWRARFPSIWSAPKSRTARTRTRLVWWRITRFSRRGGASGKRPCAPWIARAARRSFAISCARFTKPISPSRAKTSASWSGPMRSSTNCAATCLQNGLLQPETDTLIGHYDARGETLAARALKTTFLINQLPADLGLGATPAILADLLCENLRQAAALRAELDGVLALLTANGQLLKLTANCACRRAGAPGGTRISTPPAPAFSPIAARSIRRAPRPSTPWSTANLKSAARCKFCTAWPAKSARSNSPSTPRCLRPMARLGRRFRSGCATAGTRAPKISAPRRARRVWIRLCCTCFCPTKTPTRFAAPSPRFWPPARSCKSAARPPPKRATKPTPPWNRAAKKPSKRSTT